MPYAAAPSNLPDASENPGVAPSVSVLGLGSLLARFRIRHLINGVFRSPARRSMRIMLGLGLVIPVAYLALFVGAFTTIARRAAFDVQMAALGLFCGALVLASLLAKVAGADAVTAGTSENEFFLARPVSIARLMVARSLGALFVDFWGALFLFPALAAAALALGQGVAGLAVAAATSTIVQVGVVALAQAMLVILVRMVPARRRRFLWTSLSLLSALAVAGLWLTASLTLRRPDALIDWLSPRAAFFLAGPVGLLSAPMAGLVTGHSDRLARGFAGLLLGSAVAVGLTALAGRWAGRRGWEDAGAPWAEAMDRPASRLHLGGRALSVAGKDLRMLLRDRARLITLLAMPVIFVGIQIFGAAGIGFLQEQPERVAMVAYSLCAYVAVIGPLAHMQSERHAFWILRTVPVPMGRLMAEKALVWSVFVGLLAVVSFLGLATWTYGAAAWSATNLKLLGLVTGGAVTTTVLAVAIGCDAADLTRPGRSAVTAGTIYSFLVVAGIFNVVLVRQDDILPRAMVLFLAAVVLFWRSGMKRAADCLDAESVAARRESAGDGVAASILLFLGMRATAMGTSAALLPTPTRRAAEVVWAGLIAIAAMAQIVPPWLRGVRTASLARAIPRALAAGLLFAAIGIAVRFLMGSPREPTAGWPLGPSVVVFAEELVFRGITQRTLTGEWSGYRGALAAWGIASVLAVAAAATPLSMATVATQVLAGGAYFAGRSIGSGLLARLPLLF